MPAPPRIGLVLHKDYKDENGRLICCACGKSFPYDRVNNLKGNKLEVYYLIVASFCTIILIHFSVHVNTVHHKKKDFSCDVRGARFGTKGDVGRHTEAAHEYQSWRCNVCSEIFSIFTP